MGKRRAPVTQDEYRSLSELRHTIRRFLRFSEEAALAVGIEPVQHQALLAIKGSSESASIGWLAERLCVRPHTAVGLVNRMRTEGLVRRISDASDGRRVCLELTPRGEAILAKLSVAHRDELQHLGPHLQTLLRRLGAPRKAAKPKPGV